MDIFYCFEDLLDHYGETIYLTPDLKKVDFDYDWCDEYVPFGYNIPDTREILNRFRSFTVEELRSEWSSYGLLLNDSKSFAYQRLIPTIEWLEQTGYLSYLPDRDGQLTFCKTEYLHELLEDSNLHF